MVSQQRLSEEPGNAGTDEDADSDDWPDDASVATSNEDSKDGCLDIVAADDTQPGFGNIVVKNSSEVHFGNKTFYQGPVTIKQFLYNNAPSDPNLSIKGVDNPNLVTDSAYVVNNCDNGHTNNIINGANGFTKGNYSEEVKKEPKPWVAHITRNYKIYTICTCVILSLFGIILTTLLITKLGKTYQSSLANSGIPRDSDELLQDKPGSVPIDPDTNVTLNGLRIFARHQWVAQPPVHPATPLKTPVPYVIILHTATENCTDFANCVKHIRYIQSFHIDSNGWWDIGYNFLVGGDGFPYEGRGWTNEGAFTAGYNARAIGIAFIGTFNSILPPKKQIVAAQKLIAFGVKEGYIAENYKLFAHRQLSTTQSPGQKLYENIKTWPHWASKPDEGVS